MSVENIHQVYTICFCAQTMVSFCTFYVIKDHGEKHALTKKFHSLSRALGLW